MENYKRILMSSKLFENQSENKQNELFVVITLLFRQKLHLKKMY